LGGKAATEAELDRLGFVDVYTLAEYRCRGSLILLQLAYPHGWTVRRECRVRVLRGRARVTTHARSPRRCEMIARQSVAGI
jgi:hypothetical protein